MGTVDKTTPDIHRGAIPRIQIQGIRRCGTAGNIDDGVDPAHFVKVNLFRGNAVDATLRLRQQSESSEAKVKGALGQVRAHKQAANLGQAAPVLVFVALVVVGVVMVMRVAMVVRVIVAMTRALLLSSDRPSGGRRPHALGRRP